MKKRNGGYALPYVLVVMTILSLVSVSIMSNVLTGLQTQKRSTERMQNRYAAEGEIEKVFAQLHTLKGKEIQATVDSTNQSLGGSGTDAQEAKSRIQKAFDNEVMSFLKSDAKNVEFGKSTYDSGIYTCELTSENEGATISCILNLTVTVEEKKDSGEAKDSTESEDSSGLPESSEPANENEVTYTYTVNSLEITYSSYVITYK